MVVASGNDLIRHITERVVRYIDTPKETRREAKQTGKPKETWQYRWFGMMPVAIQVWKHSLERRKRSREWDEAALRPENADADAVTDDDIGEGSSLQMENPCVR